MPNGMRDLRDFQQMPEAEFRMYLFMEIREIKERLPQKINFKTIIMCGVPVLTALIALIVAISK